MAILSSVDLGKDIFYLLVDHDPTAAATDAGFGSIINYNGNLYVKMDNGPTTNLKVLPSYDIGFSGLPPYFYGESNTESSTTSTTYQTKTNLTFNVLSSGNYLFICYCDIANTDSNKESPIRLLLNDSTAIIEASVPNRSSYPTYYSYSGMMRFSLSSGSNNAKIQWKSGNLTAYIKNARISILSNF